LPAGQTASIAFTQRSSFWFLPRDAMLARYMRSSCHSCVHLSVHPPDCHTDHRHLCTARWARGTASHGSVSTQQQRRPVHCAGATFCTEKGEISSRSHLFGCYLLRAWSSHFVWSP